MSELFGTPSGFRAYDKDQADLREMASRDQLLKAQTQHQGTLMELNRAQTGAIARKAAADDAELAMMQQALSAPGEAAASGNPVAANITKLTALGNNLVAGGLVEKGVKFLKSAADLTEGVAKTEATKALEHSRRVTADAKKAAFISDLWSRVQGPQDHAAALMILRNNPLTKDEPIPDYLTTYNPAVVKQIAAGSKATHDRIMEGLRASDVASGIARREAQTATDGIRTGIMRERANAYVAGKENREKAGGGRAVTPPSTQQRADVLREVRSLGYKVDDASAGIMAEAIAEDAKILATRNPALSFSQARSRAIQDAVERGDLEKGGTFSSDKFTRQGGSLSRPLAPPKTAAELKSGAYYRDDDGSVKRFNGKSFELALSAGKAPRFAAAEEGDEE